MTNEKMTYATALNFVLENCELPKDVKAKLTKLKEQNEKKSSADRKPTAKQEENEGLKKAIVDGMEKDRLYTITELMKVIPELEGITNQRVSAIIRPLLGVKIERIEDKRKAYFKKIIAE